MTDGVGSRQYLGTMNRRPAIGFALLALSLSACLDSDTGSQREGQDTERGDVLSEVSDTAHLDTSREETAAGTPETADARDTQPGDDGDDIDVAGDVRPGCPVAVIEVSPGTQVEPGTTLLIDGSRSHSPNGAIVGFEWQLDQPNGSYGTFLPSSTVGSPQLETHLSGVYFLRLHVYDELGMRSCEQAELAVYANPTDAIRIELLWRGFDPQAPNEFDTGPDLDLHFAHPLAFGEGPDDYRDGGWFDTTFDTFWYNPAPNWGALDPAVDDDPRLEREDTSNQGPEIITLSNPEPGTVYRVGVHVWDDHGHVDILATLRIYFHGVPVFEMSGVELSHRDFWVVTSFRWGDVNPPALMRRCEGDTLTCRYDAECESGRCGLHVISPLNPPMFPGR